MCMRKQRFWLYDTSFEKLKYYTVIRMRGGGEFLWRYDVTNDIQYM
jgi:hypothetical protein